MSPGFRSVASSLLLLLLAACAPASVDPPASPPSVKVQTLHTEDAELRVALPGRVVTRQTAEIRPQVDGVIARVLFEEGSMVHKGQALYQLDDATLRAGQQEARARLRHALAASSTARQQVTRLTELARAQLVSQEALEQAVTARTQSDAEVGMAKAALEVARVAVAHGRIVAPISGRISRSSVTVGTLVTAHQAGVMATIDTLDPIHVDVVQSAAQWLRLRSDVAEGRLRDNRALPVEIELEDGSLLPERGTLTFSDVRVDEGTGTYGLRIQLANADGMLLPGMYVTARLGAGLRRNALLVPMQAVMREASGRMTVLVVDAHDVVVARSVRLGQALGERWLVDEGLQAGDRVVMEGLHKLQAGERVVPLQAGAEGPAVAAQPARGQR